MDNKTVRAEIPLFIIENKELSMSEKVLYYALCIFAGGKRETTPSLAQLAVAAGMSDRSVQRAASSLEAKRFINRQARFSGAGCHANTLYTLLPIDNAQTTPCPNVTTENNAPRQGDTVSPDYDQKALLRSVASAFNEAFPTHPQVSAVTHRMEKNFAARLAEDKAREDIRWWQALYSKIAASPWLTGGNPTGWKCPFDFLLRADKLRKIQESQYAMGKHRGGNEDEPLDIETFVNELGRNTIPGWKDIRDNYLFQQL